MAKVASQFSSVPMTITTIGSAASTGGFMALLGTALSVAKISEIYMGGEAGTSSQVAGMVLGRVTTLAATPAVGNATTIFTDITAVAPTISSTAGFTAAATGPIVASGAQILHLSYNAYGGIVRWVSSPDQQITMYGAAAYVVGTQGTGGSLALIQVAGTASTMSGHILYEVM
jgi:hypothetical protein